MGAPGFIEAVQGALRDAEAICSAEALVSSGNFGLRILYRDPALAQDYARSFLRATPFPDTFAITLVSARDIDLSALAPLPRDQGRAHFGDGLTAIWTAGERPILHVFDHVARRALVWLAEDAAPAWELSRPACPLINAAARDSAWTVAHGAAVGRAGRFLMLAGKGRAGKTTAALACACAGWDYSGDDYVFANSSGGEVLPLYSSARLRDDMSNRFPLLISRTLHGVSRDFGEARHELDLSRTLGADRICGGRIAAILLPRRQGAASVVFTSAPRAEAFSALFTTTSASAPGSLRIYAEKLSALTARAPTWFVDTGPEPNAIPDAFERFLESV